MDGRVKTLHPKIHGGLLGRRGTDEAVMAEHGIAPIDLLVVNLYPFAATVARPGCSYGEAVENIDIGGPAMLRAAAKNHESVLVVVDPDDYALVLAALAAGGSEFELRARLATKAFAHTAAYDTMVAAYLSVAAHARRRALSRHPATGVREAAAAALRREPAPAGGVLPRPGGTRRRRRRVPACCRARSCRSTTSPTPTPPSSACGSSRAAPASSSSTPTRAVRRSAPARSRPTRRPTAPIRPRPSAASSPSTASSMPPPPRPSPRASSSRCWPRPPWPRPRCPSSRPSPTCGCWSSATWRRESGTALELRSVTGGLLVQARDLEDLPQGALQVATRRQPTEAEWADLRFAWRIAKFVKSNAIVYARDGATVGVGAGQMSRVYSTRIAAHEGRRRRAQRQGRGHGLRRVLPVPRQPRRSPPNSASAPSSSRAAASATPR